MGANQVAIVDVGVIDVFARLHLSLQLFHDIAFADQVMGDLDAGDGGESRGQHLGFIFVGRDRFGNDLDVHAGEGFRCIDEPLHFLFLVGAGKRREVADFLVEEGLRLVHAGIGRTCHRQQQACCRRQ